MSRFTAQLAIQCRQQFPGLQRQHAGRPLIFFDGPAGTQVPQRVADAMSHYLLYQNSNRGGAFEVSRESDRELANALDIFADFIGSDDPQEIIFGQNMTSLTFAFSGALARNWQAGDEIVVTATDHDANLTPWVQVAEVRGVRVHLIPMRAEDCSLDLDLLQQALNRRTKLVAVACACNVSGGLNPVQKISEMAKEVGADVFLDAVHYAPHGLIDVKRWGCDFVGFSTYKFFGPHLGVFWCKREKLESLTPLKVRPAKNQLPWNWMTGTQSHEAIIGGREAVHYLADLGRSISGNHGALLRESLAIAYSGIAEYERLLAQNLIEGLTSINGTQIYGITDPARFAERVATISFTHEKVATSKLYQGLTRRGVCCWSGNFYALEFERQFGLAPEGLIRLGLVHYNTLEEVERFLEIYRQTLKDDSGI